ncbi:MAG: hypothetical protein Q9228_006700 [Teloschistes exilis]
MGPTDSSVTNLPLPKQMPGLNFAQATMHPAKPETFFGTFVWFLIPLVIATLIAVAWLLYEKPARIYSRYVDETADVWADARENWILADGEVDETAPLAPSRYNAVKEGPLSPEGVQKLRSLILADGDANRKARKAGDRKRKNDGSISPRGRKIKIETKDGVFAQWLSEYGSCADKGESDEHETASEDWVRPFSFRAAHPDRPIRRPRKHIEHVNTP